MRYAELPPHRLQGAWTECPVAIWPIGALEWHGSHLPLGLDGIVAEAFSERLQAAVGGVLLPTLWHPMTTLPHPLSLQVKSETFGAVIGETLAGLGKAGAQVVVIVTGHYAQGHSLALFEIAQASHRDPELPNVIAAAPLEPLEDDDLLDHAGRWEAAQLLALRPDLADLSTLPDGPLQAKRDAVLGEDPRQGNAAAAMAKWEEALPIWSHWIRSALEGSTQEIAEFCARRQEHYRPYVAKHFRSTWDQAILDWWEGME